MIYDITQEYFSGSVYPGDPHPVFRRIKSFESGDPSTVTEVTAQLHAATHIDAPIHRVRGGKGISDIPLSKCIGPCEVIDGEDLTQLQKSVHKRILFKNCSEICEETAHLLIEKGVFFVAAEGPSIGNRTVHRILLENEVVILEGAALSHVPAGVYTLYAPPIPLKDCDGAPCRAVLMAE